MSSYAQPFCQIVLGRPMCLMQMIFSSRGRCKHADISCWMEGSEERQWTTHHALLRNDQ
jgi:hypothetical protein